MKPNFTKKNYYYGEISYIYNPALEIKLYYILIILLDPNIRLFAQKLSQFSPSIWAISWAVFSRKYFLRECRICGGIQKERAKCGIIAQLFFLSAGNSWLGGLYWNIMDLCNYVFHNVVLSQNSVLKFVFNVFRPQCASYESVHSHKFVLFFKRNCW